MGLERWQLAPAHPFPASLGGANVGHAAGMEFKTNTFQDTGVLLGSYGEGLFHAEPTVSIFSHLPAQLHIPDDATYKCTEPLHSLFGGLSNFP